MFGSQTLAAEDAKKQYFLAPSDLVQIPSFSHQTWGSGRYKLFNRSDVHAFALQKHGPEGLRKKREAREKREAKKREREESAEEAARALARGQPVGRPAEDAEDEGNQRASSAGARQVSKKQLDSLRKEARKALKALCTWDFLNSKNVPHGAIGTVRLPRIEQFEFCALIGKKDDPELRSVVKNGAWHTVRMPLEDFFGDVLGEDGKIHGSGGKYGCNRQIACGVNFNEVDELTVKYCAANKTMSISTWIQQDPDAHLF
uniref:Uncharacterized protein n=1 Tax=Chromera velia CCMP2878 TaxID=1169474 RepID=A0A0G4I942_9ALVE|mmetsp:Transcript_46659/g.92109  ORF Transcript_46659/g.92109 Transcript_46659/m.92109 type:complete len:259 (-) Transcript_46659:1344-2120(-)|eukprot:Cvel_12149.t1-p1 / transcript=Cvel_12149.t1 / gene=Cvel_12149 / organism=Chromera_velia_CCMP2878 / gene_product=hypothetical protein / transcript_product=hypothetical protein / location=Cvel_scaffold783:30072-31332(-) / protein_length=258 / sequence_SO=supercontig / SO=protein_coding / is_pseudo=false